MRRLHPGVIAAVAAILGVVPGTAWAQVSEAERLAEQWRAAKRAELLAQRDALDRQIVAIDRKATPDSLEALAATQTLASAPPSPLKAAVAPAGISSFAQQLAQEQAALATQKFGGIEFGVGISFTGDLGSNDRVTEAEIVNGIVRVTNEDNGRARIMLESHYFFTPYGGFLGLENSRRDPETRKRKYKEWGIGPFLALQPGSDNIIEAIGGGLMVGLRRDDSTTNSFNLGLGVVIDPNTRVLGDGFVANEPPPANETVIRYKEQMQTGFLALVSFTF